MTSRIDQSITPSREFKNSWDHLVYWLSRAVRTTLPRLGRGFCGSSTVAAAYKRTLDAQINCCAAHQRAHCPQKAAGALFDAAFDLTLHNKSNIDALQNMLRPEQDAEKNRLLLLTFQKAYEIATNKEIKSSIFYLVYSFEQALPKVELPVQQPIILVRPECCEPNRDETLEAEESPLARKPEEAQKEAQDSILALAEPSDSDSDVEIQAVPPPQREFAATYNLRLHMPTPELIERLVDLIESRSSVRRQDAAAIINTLPLGELRWLGLNRRLTRSQTHEMTKKL